MTICSCGQPLAPDHSCSSYSTTPTPKQQVTKEEKILDNLKSVLELVEDKEYPTRRNITDYVCLVISEFDYEIGKKAEKACESFYKEADKNL